MGGFRSLLSDPERIIDPDSDQLIQSIKMCDQNIMGLAG